MIGKGGFARVFTEKGDNKSYACKQIRVDKQHVSYFINQVNAFRALSHPNIVRCFGYRFNYFHTFDIILELVNGKTLDQMYLSKNQDLLFYWIYQICLGLAYLEEKGIVHRDIKPSNIMVDDKGIIKIIDFGISKILSNLDSNVVGTPSFIAPQILQWGIISNQCDIWSLGITFYYLIHKRLPYDQTFLHLQTEEFFDRVSSYQIKVPRTDCSLEMSNLLQRMLTKNPYKRITIKGILNHESLKSRERTFKQMYDNNI